MQIFPYDLCLYAVWCMFWQVLCAEIDFFWHWGYPLCMQQGIVGRENPIFWTTSSNTLLLKTIQNMKCQNSQMLFCSKVSFFKKYNFYQKYFQIYINRQSNKKEIKKIKRKKQKQNEEHIFEVSEVQKALDDKTICYLLLHFYLKLKFTTF